MKLSRRGLIVGQIGSNRLRLVQVLLWARARSRSRDGRAHRVAERSLGPAWRPAPGQRRAEAEERQHVHEANSRRTPEIASPEGGHVSCATRPWPFRRMRNRSLGRLLQAIGVERQHRHGCLIRRGHAAPASFGEAFERRAISAGLAWAKTLRLRSSASLSRGCLSGSFASRRCLACRLRHLSSGLQLGAAGFAHR